MQQSFGAARVDLALGLLVLWAAAACEPSRGPDSVDSPRPNEVDAGGPYVPPPCPPLGGDDEYLEVRIPSTVSEVPTANEPVEVEVGDWLGESVALDRNAELLLDVRFPTAVFEQAIARLRPGMPLVLHFEYPTALAPVPRDEFVRDAALRLLSPLGRLFIDGGGRPLGPEYEPYFWGGRPQDCIGEDDEVASYDEYRFPEDGDVVPLRELVRRTVGDQSFAVFQGSSTRRPLGEDCPFCPVTPSSVVAISLSD